MLQTVYAKEPFPDDVQCTIFLAGPTPRSSEVKSWRPAALSILKQLGFQGHVYVPEPRDGNWLGDYEDQIEWEDEALNRADVIAFWVPRDLTPDSKGEPKMPGLTTNCEWGEFKYSRKAVWGAPAAAQKIRYQESQAAKLGIPMYRSMVEMLEKAVLLCGRGARRSGGETQVPLVVWRDPTFQEWYKAMRQAGNWITKFRVYVAYPPIPPEMNSVIFWVANVTVYVAGEAREKRELVVSRKDLSIVVLYKRDPDSWLKTQLVLVREFRPAVRNPTGQVWEPPGGSSKTPTTPIECALKEVREETGLELEVQRLRTIGSRQCYATLSAHVAHVFACEVTDDELATLRGRQGIGQGEAGSSERTFIEFRTVEQVISEGLLDWTMMGAVLMSVAEVAE
jgi:8-oxo-dGTP pyrophosphatase MutT (NUDIX family)